MHIYKTGKVAFRFSPKPKEMLERVTSNLLSAAKNALLTPQGKIVGVFDQLLADPDTCFLVADGCAVETLRSIFSKYAPFSATRWEQLEEPVYFDLGVEARSSAVSDEAAGAVRGAETTVCVLPQAVGRILVGGAFAVNVTEEDFTRFRLDQHMPQQGLDFNDEMLLNVFPEDYVSYTKGCFIFQEVIALVQNLSDPPKKIVVTYEDQCSPEQKKMMTSRQADAQGQVRGFLFVDNEKSGKREVYQSLKSQFQPRP